MPFRLALNRTCAPHLSLPDFIALATTAGVQGVEIRNDIPGRESANGTPATEVRARLAEAGLGVASVNALQRFNDWTAARAQEAKALVSYAADLGAPGIVLCPVHAPDHGWSETDAEHNLRDGLRQLRPILKDHGLTGYVEPLGMTHSTLKRQRTAVAAIGDIDGWDSYRLCFDTFQSFRCGDTDLQLDHVGLAHMSGITRTDLAPEDLTEPDRGLVQSDDRVGNVGLLQRLLATGYSGFISMEPFNPSVQTDRALARNLRDSLDHVTTGLHAKKGRDA
jgi:2-keto-myo-inositol isomerase